MLVRAHAGVSSRAAAAPAATLGLRLKLGGRSSLRRPALLLSSSLSDSSSFCARSTALTRAARPPTRSSSVRAFSTAHASSSRPRQDGPGVTPPASGKSAVAAFIEENISPFAGISGDNGFTCAAPTERTAALNAKILALLAREQREGVLDVDTSTPSTVVSHAPGYIDREAELIVGLQTDVPLKRAIKPLGGVSVVRNACKAYGYELDGGVERIFTDFRRTHSDGVFAVYGEEHLNARRSGIITGLPDGYGRGRIIGDYRRVALFGVDQLIRDKEADKRAVRAQVPATAAGVATQLQLVEEIGEQIKALEELRAMAESYGVDVSQPAKTARQAVQWTYMGFLAAIKQQDGAAMSFGRVDGFFDIFFERDLASGLLTESEAQEIIDDFVLKLRLVRHLRTPEYNELFAGDPQWVTLVLGGMLPGEKPAVTKTSYRFLQTLRNLGPAPEPNLTILWSKALPQRFKEFAAQVSIDTSSIQYENDDAMSPRFGHDYSIACCVSAMSTGQQMQFFGARCNLAKLLLYSINNGVDEVSNVQVGPQFETDAKLPLLRSDGSLDYDGVMERFELANAWLAGLYCSAMNAIHWAHDKYDYESLQMALHDTDVERMMAFGIAGLSVVADSLSAIKYGSVVPVRENGVSKQFHVKGEFPKFGNDNDAVDKLAVEAIRRFEGELRKNPTYRDASHTLSVLTITSNVVYGKKTGDTPDGRKLGEPFAPGANAMHQRDETGALASLNSIAKLPYEHALDGISNTFSLVPSTLGKMQQSANLASILDGYFVSGGQHINVNVLNRETLEDAMVHPEKYPQLTIRVSGYAVNFIRLTAEQQREVISRTFHKSM